MTLDWSPGPLPEDVYAARRDEATKLELNRLLVSPEFQAWQQRKASRVETVVQRVIRWDVTIAASMVCMGVLLLSACLGLALLPARNAAGPSAVLVSAPAAPLAASPASVTAACNSTRSYNWHAPKQVPRQLRLQQEALQIQLLAQRWELERVRLELEAAREENGGLALRLQKMSGTRSQGSVSWQNLLLKAPPGLEPSPHASAAMHRPAGLGVPTPQYANASSQGLPFSTWADKPAGQAGPTPGLGLDLLALAAADAPLLALLGASAMVACYLSAWATARRLRRQSQELETQLQAAANELEDTAFAKETAEQSVQLLEDELRRKVDQVQAMQTQLAHAVAPLPSVCSPTVALPPMHHTPGRGELPPPPAQLVEKFLQERHAVAVDEAQVQEWLGMEVEFERMRDELSMLMMQQSSMEATHNLLSNDSGLKSQEEHTGQLREWLDVAQAELQDTQAQLLEREKECRRLAALVAAAGLAGTQGEGAHGSTCLAAAKKNLMEQNLALVEQLQSVTSAFEALQVQLSSTQAELLNKEAESRRSALEREVEVQKELASPAPSSCGTDLGDDVDSMRELLRATRASLASRLNRSIEVYSQAQQAISGLPKLARNQEEELQRRASDILNAPPGMYSSPRPGLSRQSSPLAAPSRQASPPPVLACYSSTPSRRSQEPDTSHVLSSQNIQLTPPSAGPHESGLREPNSAAKQPVLTNFSFTLPAKRITPNRPRDSSKMTPVPGKENCEGAAARISGMDGSLRKTREAAKREVQELRAQLSNFELGAFLARLGCQVSISVATTAREFRELKEQGIAMLRHRAAQDKHAHGRAVAGEALQLLQDWDWPVKRVRAPPQSPSWVERLGLSLGPVM